jgi:hypothetical protein
MRNKFLIVFSILACGIIFCLNPRVRATPPLGYSKSDDSPFTTSSAPSKENFNYVFEKVDEQLGLLIAGGAISKATFTEITTDYIYGTPFIPAYTSSKGTTTDSTSTNIYTTNITASGNLNFPNDSIDAIDIAAGTLGADVIASSAAVNVIGNRQIIDAITFTTVDTGQGANELYDMDQNVLTTSDVTFAKISVDSMTIVWSTHTWINTTNFEATRATSTDIMATRYWIGSNYFNEISTDRSLGSEGKFTVVSEDAIVNYFEVGIANPSTGTAVTALVRNNTGVTLPIFKAVRINGSVGAVLSVELVNSTDTTNAEADAVTTEAISNGSTGIIQSHGFLTGIDTSGFAAEDNLYLGDEDGEITSTKPTSGRVQHLGTVGRSHATQGIVYLSVEGAEPYLAAARGEDVDIRGGSLGGEDIIHFEDFNDVVQATMTANGDLELNGYLTVQGTCTHEGNVIAPDITANEVIVSTLSSSGNMHLIACGDEDDYLKYSVVNNETVLTIVGGYRLIFKSDGAIASTVSFQEDDTKYLITGWDLANDVADLFSSHDLHVHADGKTALYYYFDTPSTATIKVAGTQSVSDPYLECADHEYGGNVKTEWRFADDGSNPKNLWSVGIDGGYVRSKSATADPQLEDLSINDVSGTNYPIVKIKMWLEEGAGAGQQILWTNEYGGISADRSQTFSGIDDEQWHIYEIDLSADTSWYGTTIDGFRLDPHSINGKEFKIDWMRTYEELSKDATSWIGIHNGAGEFNRLEDADTWTFSNCTATETWIVGGAITDDSIQDTDIDWGTGSGQVSSDDVTEGTSNLYNTTAGDYGDWSADIPSNAYETTQLAMWTSPNYAVTITTISITYPYGTTTPVQITATTSDLSDATIPALSQISFDCVDVDVVDSFDIELSTSVTDPFSSILTSTDTLQMTGATEDGDPIQVKIEWTKD